jgi:glucosamine--fructose-6-phosphate aminotransferase (isomerizing)
MKKLINSLLHNEIHEQPFILNRLLKTAKDSVQELAEAMVSRDIRHIVIAARGTSDNAARYAKYTLGAMNGLVVSLATPSLYSLYKQPPRLDDTLVIGVSQSGKSPDIVSVLAEAQRQGALTGVITNSPDSDLASLGDVVIDINAGAELAVAATKSYTAELGAIAMLSTALGSSEKRWAQLSAIPDAITATLRMSDVIGRAAPRYRYMERCVVIGRGYNYATAFELSLKMTELTYTVVQPFSSADFLHGPLALIEPGFPVIVIAVSGAIEAEVAAFARDLKSHQAEVIAISDISDVLNVSRIPLELPLSVAEWLSPIVAIVPGQLFTMHLAHTRDHDIDAPRKLRKITETI